MSSKLLNFSAFGALFFTFSCRCWIQFFPSLNLRFASTILAGMSMLCLLITLWKGIGKNLNTNKPLHYNIYLWLFIIYSAYCAYYIINPMTTEVEQVPDSIGEYMRSLVTLLLFILIPGTISKKLDMVIFSKFTVVSILIFLLVYFSRINIFFYGATYGMNSKEIELIIPQGFIDGLSMGSIVSLAFCCNLFVSEAWVKNKKLGYVVAIAIAIALFVIQFMMVERGPILALVLISLFYLYIKRIITPKYFVPVLLFMFFVYMFRGELLSLLSQVSSSTVEKFASTADDGGSGRFGDSDAIFPASMKQILESPVFGSYFRCFYGKYIGGYPHNIILELLMTFGFLFTLPFLWVCYKACVIVYRSSGTRSPQLLFGLLFFNRFLLHMTSGTVLGDNMFWLSLAIILYSGSKTMTNNNKVLIQK